MKYNGAIYRPPIEAETLLIPITEGCSHNSCTFCNMYKGIPFKMISLKDVEEYLQEVQTIYGKYCSMIDRVYLVGADPFALPTNRLLERIELIRKYLPNIEVVTMYARVDNISNKSDLDLIKLRDAGVTNLYIGVECALDDVLESFNKGYSSEETRTQCLRLNRLGIKHCDLMMLGTAGSGRGIESAIASAKLENETRPDKILITMMTAFVNTQLDDEIQSGKFIPASERENIEEERALIDALDLPQTYFWSLHALDSVKIAGYLGEEKSEMLNALSQSIAHADNVSIVRKSRTGTL